MRRLLGQIDAWRKELINLARNNRLLYFRHTKSSTVEIVCDPARAAEVVQRLLSGGSWRFFFPPDEEDSEQQELGDGLLGRETLPLPAADELETTKDARALANSLRLLDRKATQEFMDKGLWVLYLAAGMLHWIDPDTREEADSPLVLIPVSLERRNPREPYELRKAEEEIDLNPALSIKLSEYGIELPEFESDDLILMDLLAQVEARVRGRAGWRVDARLIMAPFSFHKEVMYRDLLRNEDQIAEHGIVQALIEGAPEHAPHDFDPVPEDRLDESAPPEHVNAILDADATQRQCIAAAVAGGSFVMDGPPGTGKSQTIANIIAELLSRERTVLFVSEKAAALEVVQKRLDAAGLADYTLELHSHKATRREVAMQLGASLERHPQRRAGMTEANVQRLTRRRLQLSRYAAEMNESRLPIQRSLHQAIGRVCALQQSSPRAWCNSPAGQATVSSRTSWLGLSFL